MTGDEWKKMERVIPFAPWTNLHLGCDKEERMKKRKERMKKRKNKQTVIGIGAEGVIKISESLKVNTTLTKLILNCDE